MKKLFILANVVLICILAALLAWQGLRDRNQVIEATYISLEQATSAVSEHVQQTLSALDLALSAVAIQGLRFGTSGDESRADLTQVLQNRQADSTNTYLFYVIDAQGQVFASSRTPAPAALDLSQLAEFTAHRENNSNELYISLPRLGVVGDALGKWIITLSRRIPSREGGFGGVAVAALSVDYLVDFYNVIRPIEHGAVGLLDANGQMLATSPWEPGPPGSVLTAMPPFAPGELPQFGRSSQLSSATGSNLLLDVRPAWNNQLAVYASVTEAEALNTWRERLAIKLAIVLLVSLMFMGISTAIWLFSRRKQQWIEDKLTIQNQAFAELEAAKAEIQTIFESISDAVFALDREWRFSYMNAEAERVLERPSTELLGKNVWKEFPEAAGTIFEEQYRKAVSDHVPVSFEQYYPPLTKWFMVRAFPQKNGLTVYFQDYTARREVEERMRQSQKMDALGRLTGGIAHDFNNLLTIILGNIDELRVYLNGHPEEVRGQAEVICLAGERAAELTHRLLAFARRQPLNPQAINVNELVHEVKQLLRRTVSQDIHIELVRSASLWPALADPNELQNAILNLALNARDAMPEGGKITIETGNVAVDQDYADFNEIPVGSYCMIAVSDTGHGMEAEAITRAFEPFFTTKPDGKGTGLGLAMVYGFARQSGGVVKIYSELNEGTSVRLYLPRARSTGEVLFRRSTPTSEKRGNGERILLVEDDELVRQYTARSLRHLGYEVTECDNGREALRLLDANIPYDLLFTDVVLAGGVSGKEVAAAAQRKWPQIKVLYMSGYTENSIVHHGRLDPGVELLSKPFRLSSLAKKTREVLDAVE